MKSKDLHALNGIHILVVISLYLQTFLNFLENLLNMVEKFMIHNANRVAVCRKWPMLSPSTQRRIKDAALVVVEFSRPSAPRPRLSSSNRVSAGFILILVSEIRKSTKYVLSVYVITCLCVVREFYIYRAPHLILSFQSLFFFSYQSFLFFFSPFVY